jgi:hypothetical protein
MPYYSSQKNLLQREQTRHHTMMDEVLGDSRVYIRSYRDMDGSEYFALNTVQGETLATFASQDDAAAAIQQCQLEVVALN